MTWLLVVPHHGTQEPYLVDGNDVHAMEKLGAEMQDRESMVFGHTDLYAVSPAGVVPAKVRPVTHWEVEEVDDDTVSIYSHHSAEPVATRPLPRPQERAPSFDLPQRTPGPPDPAFGALRGEAGEPPPPYFVEGTPEGARGLDSDMPARVGPFQRRGKHDDGS